MADSLTIGIIGGGGYTGLELLRLLDRHPQARVVKIASRTLAGRAVLDAYPTMRAAIADTDLTYCAPDAAAFADCDVVFTATPQGTAMHYAEALLAAGAKLVDLSADFRLADAQLWARWYGMPHACPALLGEAVYGLPEINRAQIRDARLVANPGCYPTAVQLGFLPLLENHAREPLVDVANLIADAKSGVSGAGRPADGHSNSDSNSDGGENFKAYAVDGHRHLPEIVQTLNRVVAGDGDGHGDDRHGDGGEVQVIFAPHLLPIFRGIHATLYARLTREVDLQQLYEQRFADEPFVEVLPAGAHPDTAAVAGKNTCQIALHRPADNTAVILITEDNLVKGAAGQAIQNMNLMCGLGETAGLDGAMELPVGEYLG